MKLFVEPSADAPLVWIEVAIRGGAVVTPHEVIDNGIILCEDGRIKFVGRMNEADPEPNSQIIDASAQTVFPGLIDTHVHGSGGNDLMAGGVEGIRRVSRAQFRYGVTAYLPTTIAARHTELLRMIEETLANVPYEKFFRDQAVFGDAAEVVDRLQAARDEFGLSQIIAWFDQGGALKVPGDERAELCYRGFAVVPGLVDLVSDVGLATKSDHARAVAACELVLEGLAAQKRISRSEELGYTRARPERREPGYGKGGISFG